jgi:allantoinase
VVGPDEVPAGVPVVDAVERLVLPGLVDTHVHINEPGRTEWEGFATATRAAAAGGVTTLIDMPLNSSPVTTTVAALKAKRDAAAGQLWVDVGFHGGVVPGNADQIEPLIAEGVCAFKAFLCPSGIDEFPAATEPDLRAVMPILAAAGVPLFVHAELVSPLPAGVEEAFAANPRSYAAYLATRPPEWEEAAIRLLIALCREYRCWVHVVHLSAPKVVDRLISDAMVKKLPIGVETCPHYLTFCAEEIPDAEPVFKCAPPIRIRNQRDRLRKMTTEGRIFTLGSDHSPAPPSQKHLFDGDLRAAWGGIASLQLLLPAAWTAMSLMKPAHLVAMLSRLPAQLVGLKGRKGMIARGHDADLVVFDPVAEFTVTADMLEHRHKPTPYLGRTLRGVVQTTYLRGRKVYDRGRFLGDPGGQLLERPRVSTP